ncbi:HD domain-containing protein [Candidatus Vallotiella sp. (ex Adelges kitamiensis)]|uniref:HD domain-containing protein n=1 Tax=Candidatus Vallotiella sp. (ex Adelges kitamiensis) TaxID=2864217 RepID=UPI001CE2715C|nr:HD domain-containing protein [Candidatus Vallotia sp. (ex Adelges kitamiensis)]
MDKIEFRNREEAQVENFREILLAMARDMRVILIKLSDQRYNCLPGYSATGEISVGNARDN